MTLATLDRLREERIGASDSLPDLIDRLKATERLYLLLSERSETPVELVNRAQCQAIDLRVMTTFRLQQMEMLEVSSSQNRAYLFWSSVSRLWVCEVEAL